MCLRDVTVDGIAEAFAEQGVTHLCGAPIVVNLAIQAMERAAPGRRIRMMTAGAAPAAATLRRAAAAGLDVTHVYGMTETFGPAAVCEARSSWPAAEVPAKTARQGVAHAAGGRLDVVDPDTGAPVPNDGETMGEVVFGGNVVMKGYLKDEAATDAAFKLGALASGDLAVKDEDGYVAIRDRSKDLIISGGENVSSLSVEAALMEHDAVALCAVVARPDEKWGETPCAFVETAHEVDAAELLAFAKARLPKFAAPKTLTLPFQIRDSLVRRVRIRFSIKRILTQQLDVHLEGLALVLEPRHGDPTVEEARDIFRGAKQRAILGAEMWSVPLNSLLERELDGQPEAGRFSHMKAVLKRAIGQAVRQARLHVQSVHLRYESYVDGGQLAAWQPSASRTTQLGRQGQRLSVVAPLSRLKWARASERLVVVPATTPFQVWTIAAGVQEVGSKSCRGADTSRLAALLLMAAANGHAVPASNGHAPAPAPEEVCPTPTNHRPPRQRSSSGVWQGGFLDASCCAVGGRAVVVVWLTACAVRRARADGDS